jgi:hypothetical protein
MIHYFYFFFIDPGTGSALFSILIGAAATIYFLGRALFIKLKVVISGGKIPKSSIFENNYVIYNEGSQYSDVFKPVLDEFEAKGINILYLSSGKNDPLLNEPYNFVKKEFIGEENKAFLRLNMLKAGIVLMTTPGLDVYQLKRSKGVKHYSHVLHASSDAVLYRLFGIDYFDSILLTGDYQANDIRFLEKQRSINEKSLVTVGCTYLDVYAEEIKQIPKDENSPFTVLVSPSWGPSAILSRYGEKLLDPLSKSDFKIIIRPHPQSKKSEADILARLHARYNDFENIFWDYERENIFSISKADIMISDFSGIIFDYMFLRDKPVLYVNYDFDFRPYDADDLDHELWEFKIIKEAGIELLENDFSQITEIIKSAKDNEALAAARMKARETAWQYPGESGKRIFDFMTKVVNDR